MTRTNAAWFPSLLALALLLCGGGPAACKSKPKTDEPAQTKFELLPATTQVQVGQSLVLVLPVRPKTGHSWRLTGQLPPFIGLIGDTVEESPLEQEFDTQILTFEISAPGETDIVLYLAARGGRAAEPLQTRQTKVIAKTSTGANPAAQSRSR
ncbi:MAG: protease inhibitor I42 family protein [Planctomycetota bacterium]